MNHLNRKVRNGAGNHQMFEQPPLSKSVAPFGGFSASSAEWARDEKMRPVTRPPFDHRIGRRTMGGGKQEMCLIERP